MPSSGFPEMDLPAWALTKGLGTSSKSEFDRWMKEEEVEKLLDAARTGKEKWAPMAYVALVLMANLGVRVGEIVLFEEKHFSSIRSHNAIQVPSLKKKRSGLTASTNAVLRMSPAELERFRARVEQARRTKSKPPLIAIYLGEQEKKGLAPIIERRIREQRDNDDIRLFPHSKRYLQYLFNYYRAKAKLRVGLSPHSLRRFVATRIATLTGEPRLAVRRLRHQEDVTMQSYIQFPPEKQIEMLARVKPVL